MQWAWPNPFFHVGSRGREKNILKFFSFALQGFRQLSAVTFCQSSCPFLLLITAHSKTIRQVNGIKKRWRLSKAVGILPRNCLAVTSGAYGVSWEKTVQFSCPSLLPFLQTFQMDWDTCAAQVMSENEWGINEESCSQSGFFSWEWLRMRCKRLSESLQHQSFPGGAQCAPADGVLLLWLTPVHEKG